MVLRSFIPLALCFALLSAGSLEAAGGKVPLLDSIGETQGTVVVKLEKGLVKAKFTLAPLPASVDTGTEVFEATIYMAYLVNSQDAAVEVSLGAVYPNAKSRAKLKAKLGGDLSRLGLDRFVVVAYSKDGLDSFDVLTGTLEAE